MIIHFATADWGMDPNTREVTPGGANWARVQQPARQLAAAGHEVYIGTSVAIEASTNRLVAASETGEILGEEIPEVVVLQRWMAKEAPQIIANAVAAGQVVVNDVDDWFDGLDPANQAFKQTSPSFNPDSNRDHYRHALGASSLVTVSTQFLADRYTKLFGSRVPVKVIRNAMRLQDFTTQPVRPDNDGLLVCWVGGVSWRSGDLETLAPILPGWLRANGAKFLHHGAIPGKAPAWELLEIPIEDVAGWRPMVPANMYGKHLMAGFDIGLVPLSDVPFNHAKSWIKGLEYSAAGIPFVGTRTVEYEALGAGLLAKRPRDWIRHLDRLLDPSVRADQARIGLEAAARVGDIQQRWTDWEQAYEWALRRAGARQLT